MAASDFVLNTTTRQRVLGWLQPHRIALIAIGLLIVGSAIFFMRWDWLPNYADMALQGIWRTIWLLVVTALAALLRAGFAVPAISMDPRILAVALPAPGLALCSAVAHAFLRRL